MSTLIVALLAMLTLGGLIVLGSLFLFRDRGGRSRESGRRGGDGDGGWWWWGASPGGDGDGDGGGGGDGGDGGGGDGGGGD
jgi:hypothetical protein